MENRNSRKDMIIRQNVSFNLSIYNFPLLCIKWSIALYVFQKNRSITLTYHWIYLQSLFCDFCTTFECNKADQKWTFTKVKLNRDPLM